MNNKVENKMMKPAGKRALVPRLRFAEFWDAGDWDEKKVGDVFKVTRGEVLSMPLVTDTKRNGAQYPVYSSQTKNDGLAGFYTEYLYEDAITWTTDGANAGDVNYRKGKFYCTNVCGVLINENGHANPCVAALINSISKNYVSYVGNPKLMNGVMSNIVIPFPSVDEQQKIADCLSSIDELITLEAQKLDTLKVYKKGLMQQLFPAEGETVPKLRFAEFRGAGEWKRKKLGEIGNVLMCKRIFTNETNGSSGVPFYKIGTLGGKPDAFISNKLFNDYKSNYNFPRNGEILITCSGTVGKCLPYDGEDAYYQDSNIVWIDNPILEISNDFLLYLLTIVNWEKLNSTTITRIYGNDFRGLSLLFPDSEREQKEIVDFLSSIDKLVTAQTQKLDTLKTHKKGLMQQLFPSLDEVTL